jgi:group I intron endonuclease
MSIIGAYVLTDTYTGQFYIGSSVDINNRFNEHIQTLNRNAHQNLNLQNLWNTGRCNLELGIFPTETREAAYSLEQELIINNKDSPSLLNIGLGVYGGDNITLHPNRENIINQMKDTLADTITKLTQEERILIYGRKGSNNGMYGKTHTPEVKKRLSEARTGKKHTTTWTLTDEQRTKISEQAKLRVGELNPFYGKQHTPETKKKLSDAIKAKNMIPTNARKVKIDNVVYNSVTDASRNLNVSPALIIYRITSIKEKYKNYSYLL